MSCKPQSVAQNPELSVNLNKFVIDARQPAEKSGGLEKYLKVADTLKHGYFSRTQKLWQDLIKNSLNSLVCPQTKEKK